MLNKDMMNIVTGVRARVITVLLLLVLTSSPLASLQALTRPVDQKIFCGQGRNAETEADAYLKSRSDDPSSITGLTPDFKCGLAQLIQAAPGNIRINVGTYVVTASVKTHGAAYCQRRQCIEGTMSHPRGLAADLLYDGQKGPGGAPASAWCRSNSLCSWAHQNAPQYGLMFRLMPDSGCPSGYHEPWHIELRGVAGCMGNDPGGGGGGLFSGLANIIGSALGLLATSTKKDDAPPPRVSTTTNASSTIDINDLFGNGTTNNSTSTQSHATSVADVLETLAFGTPQTGTTSTSTVPLVVSGADSRGLTSGGRTTVESPAFGGTSALSQQTFTSSDLSWNQAPATPLGGWSGIIAAIKATIQRMLQYLQPREPEPTSEETQLFQ